MASGSVVVYSDMKTPFLLPVRLVVALAFLAATRGDSVAEELLRLTPAGRADGALTVDVAGYGTRYAIESSTNLVDWLDWGVGELTNFVGRFVDPAAGQEERRFYRGRLVFLSELEPRETHLFSGDTLLFRVTGGEAGVGWVFKANGLAGGNPALGTVVADPLDPARAAYHAPLGIAAPFEVTICAEDPGDPGRSFCAKVQVLPLSGVLAVTPGAALVRVGGAMAFQAGAMVPGVGFVPFRQVYWKLNGQLGRGPTAELGVVDLDGLYTAPPALPAARPQAIEVGFSTTLDGPVLSAATVTLAAVSVDPPRLVSVQAGPVGAVLATLEKSDGTSRALGAGEVAFQSGYEGVATVDGTGQVTVGPAMGVSSIQATHLETGAVGSMVVESRPDVHVRLLSVRQRSPHVININPTASGFVFRTPTTPVSEIEVTQPGVMFNLAPDLFFFRGATNFATNSFAGAGHRAVSFSGDGQQVRHFHVGGPVVQASGLTARIEERTGLVEVGDTPGAGVVTMTYDDGVITRTATTRVRFTRLHLTATAEGTVTHRTHEAQVSEWISLRIKVTNPRTENSRFMGDTLVRVRQQGERFLVARIPEKYGFTQLPVHKEIVDTAEYVHLLPSGPSGRNPDPFLNALGEVQLWVMAQRGGAHRFVVDLPSDPGVPPVEIAMDLRLPELRFKPMAGVTNGSAVVQNSYFDLQFASNALSLVSTPLHPDFAQSSQRFHLGRSLAWFVRRPDGTTNQVEAGTASFGGLEPFPLTLREVGPHEVWLGYREWPGLRSAGVPVEVVAPAGPLFAEVMNVPLRPQTNHLGHPVLRENQYAGLHVVAPTLAGFTEGIPLTVTARLFTADGVAKRLGKRIVNRHRTSSNPDHPTWTTNYVMGGVELGNAAGGRYYQVQTPALGSGLYPADENGFVTFAIVVSPAEDPGTLRQPVRLELRPALRTFQGGELSSPPGDLPVEFFDHLDGVLVSASTVPMAVAQFENAPDTALRWQIASLGGHGVTAVPRAIPVASARVRDAVAAGRLPAGSERATFTLWGGDDFGAALAAGAPAVDLGDGLQVVEQAVQGNALTLTVTTDLAHFEEDEFNPPYGDRAIHLVFPDGARWTSELSVFGYRIEPQEFAVDRNIPLNAAYGHFEMGFSPTQRLPFRDEEGSVLFELKGRGFWQIWGVDLELRPSLHACWDGNRNGLEEPGEDLDGDGFLTEADVGLPATFRGARPENPLVGFRRDIDPRQAAWRVRQLRQHLLPSYGGQFRVFADPTDHRRLHREARTLGPKFDPDLIPDFVSTAADAEMLLAAAGPNLFDVRFFSVYNFMAEVRQDLPDPGVAFETVGQSRDAAYAAYAGTDGALSLGSPEANARAARGVSVYVDHEATPWDFHEDEPVLTGLFPFQFYGGVLDQKWQRRVINAGSAGIPATPLFTDDRQRPYASRYLGPAPTGAQRVGFGVDLDGVLYDPTWLNFPPPRFWDLDPVKTWLAAQRLDEDPNGPALRSIPVVAALLEDPTPTSAHLLRRVGATSGGFVDLSRHAPGRLGAESKSPGADFPGLHAGYLVFGRPQDVRDPRNGLVEDDIRDVLIKRDAATGNLVRENRFLGTPASRFVHGLAHNEDLKDALRTSAQVNVRFAIGTDPPNVVPDNPATWKLRPNILIRELLAPDTTPDLVVTSQSEGNERIIKLVADTAVDFAVDMTAGAVLATMTAGSYLEACAAPELGEKALGALRSLAVGIADAEFIEPYYEKNHREALHFVNRNFTSTSFTNLPIPGVNWGESAKILRDPVLLNGLLSVVSNQFYGVATNALHGLGVTNLAPYLDVTPESRIPDLLSPPTSLCDLLGKPIDRLKDEIKATYSAETFGGLGSAEAAGTKVLSVAIPRSAQRTPGVFLMTFAVTRRIDVQPKEPNERRLEDLPWASVFPSYPFADQVSDETFLRTLLAKRLDPVAGEDATRIWRAVQRQTVRRSVAGDRYQSYKIRSWQMPGLSATLAPFQQTGAGQAIGDFVLTPYETELPVAAAVGAVVSRANENATARAFVTAPGYEVILHSGTLMKP